jgi:hypothetical protein
VLRTLRGVQVSVGSDGFCRLKVKFHLDEVPLFEPRHNVSPTQTVPAVITENGNHHLAMLRRSSS